MSRDLLLSNLKKSNSPGNSLIPRQFSVQKLLSGRLCARGEGAVGGGITLQAHEPPLPCCPKGPPSPALTLWLQLAQDGLCPSDHAAHSHSSHSLSHTADTTEAGVGLLGVVVGRGDQVEGRIEQGQVGDSIDSALNPRETLTLENPELVGEHSHVSVQKGPSKSISSSSNSSKGLHQVNEPGFRSLNSVLVNSESYWFQHQTKCGRRACNSSCFRTTFIIWPALKLSLEQINYLLL